MILRPTHVCAGIFVLLVADVASAQSDATAELLFRDGKQLLADKNYAEACPKFAESARLAPSSGVELALGLCYEAEGKTASAFGAFTAVIALARRDARRDREKVAIAHAKALEGRLARVTFAVDRAASALEGFELRQDGVVIGSAAWADVPVDAGAHQVDAVAPGYLTYTTTFSTTDGVPATVPIPALAPVPALPKGLVPLAAPPPSAPVPWRTVAVVTGGAGVATLAVGAIVGAMALSKVNEAQKACPESPCSNASGVSENNAAGSLADASTGLFITGAVLAGAGVATFFLATRTDAPAAKTASSGPVVAPGYLGWRGVF